MKIVLTGGGTGGHFYPLIAVLDEIKDECFKNGIVTPTFYYFGKENYNAQILLEKGVMYKWIPSGKNRLYFSLLNYLDIFKLAFGIIISFFKLLIVYPDIIFAKGGHDSIPTCIAAKMLGIPIFLHDSDSIPGRASLLISRIASRVAVSYSESISFYKNKNIVAYTGQPILKKYLPKNEVVKVYNENKKTLLITAGSLGSVKINDIILLILPELVAKYNIIHQCGEANYKDIKLRSDLILQNYSTKNYTLMPTFDFSNIYSITDLVISRAGSTMFEFLAWKIPSIIIPIDQSISRDQYSNAVTMSGKGYSKMILENNLSKGLLLNEISKILDIKENYNEMLVNINKYTNLNSSEIIAKEIIIISKTHN